VQALGGGAADHSTHAALSMFRDAAIYGWDAVDEQGNHRSFLRDLVNSNRDSGAGSGSRSTTGCLPTSPLPWSAPATC
jgi:hypothetical protein